MVDIGLWNLLAGLGLFLFGMQQLEGALKTLAGRSFKRFLRRHTERPLKGVLAGAISTAALQSSSLVSLIVLALSASHVIPLSSALGIVFGSNLGTTATGWIVASLGFRVKIETLALPLIALGGFAMLWFRTAGQKRAFFQLAMGLGLMLLGLDYMKGGAAGAASLFQPEALASYPLISFLLVGLVLTMVIQSSSATITITLSALYADVITLEAAAATAIGADLGTTITAVLGAIGGSASKKRVAFAIVLFNVVTDTIAFVLLHPLLDLVRMQDPLYSLVAFHSAFNLMGCVLFLPLVTRLSKHLESYFTGTRAPLLRYIEGSETQMSNVAIDNMERETYRLLDQAAAVNLLSMGLKPLDPFYKAGADRRWVAAFEAQADADPAYAELKRLEGAILAYGLKLQRESLAEDDSERLSHIFPAIRSAVVSAKHLRGCMHDLKMFESSADDALHAYYGHFRKGELEFYSLVSSLIQVDSAPLYLERLVELKELAERGHGDMHTLIYQDVLGATHSELEISTLLNVNRELFVSKQSFLRALASTLLSQEQAALFN